MSAYVPLAPFYDELTQDVDYSAFADFYEALFSRYGVKPDTLLDLACGTGTLTNILAERGYEMIGVDASEEMLAVAMEKAYNSDAHVRPMLLCQEMAELDLYGTVGAAFCSLDGVNYAPPEELPEIFRRLRLFIEPGGIFIFDIIPPEKLSARDGEVYIDETENAYCVWRASFDEDENACFYGIDLFIREGESWLRSEEEHIEYAHNVAALRALLEEAGFGEVVVFGNLRMESAGENEDRIFISARRME